ncbi:hypothetical protein SASPL_133815 [Salvia splendens]|uniref:MHD2 domain-containing protein n=1 Tax=Salvia splendens TaxID=180675 RepID=A0A8X8X6E8_SALSN|nr:hypothetical protein SASPL_133815 [Salvia splendens]
MPPGAVSLDDVDLHQVSVDFVLNCVLRKAIRDYHDGTLFPSMNNAGASNEFFLVTSAESSGSPPRRPPPLVPDVVAPILASLSTISEPIESDLIEESQSLSKSQSLNSTQHRELTVDDIDDFDDDIMEEMESRRYSRRVLNDASDVVLGLPSFSTGISDEDLRETAYEILLSAAGASGYCHSVIFLKTYSYAYAFVFIHQILDGSEQISEEMDIRRRRALLNAMVGKVGKRMDTLLIPLELLCCISRTEFPDKKSYIKWQKRQLNMLEEGLVNHPVVGFGESGQKASDLRILLAKIEESESFPSATGDLQRTECLRSLREITIPLAERPARGDLTGEVCHWADGYHLNVRLYEKLLLSVFDVLDEGKLTEVSGMSSALWHYLFFFFLDKYAVEVERNHGDNPLYVLCMGAISAVSHCLDSMLATLMFAAVTPYVCGTTPDRKWDLNGRGLRLINMFVITGEEDVLQHSINQLKRIPLKEQRGPQERLHLRSLTCRVQTEKGFEDLTFLQSFLIPIQKWADYHLHFPEGSRMMENALVVAMVARRLLLEEPDLGPPVTDIEQIEIYVLSSIKQAFSRNASAVAVSLIHKLYGIKLKPFLESAEHLTEDVVSVFPAADNLEQNLIAVITSTCEEGTAEAYLKKLNLYKIETVSGTLVLRWVNAQLAMERVIQQETVDQFFALKVPMRPGELRSLFRGIDSAFQVYTKHVVDSLAEKEDIIPPVPTLTRFRRESGIKAFVKKELTDQRLPDVRKSNDINYAISQLNKLEDSISERWSKKHHSHTIKKLVNSNSMNSTQKDGFDGSRKDINAAMDHMCEFTGTKTIFWDLREQFIDGLYKPSVAQSRLENVIEPLDMVLSKLCDIIVKPLRDRVVTGLLQASLDGLIRVILDGGPSRMFTPADAKFMDEDLEVLKEFFISGGDGLPRGVVENQVVRARQIIKLVWNQHTVTRELIEELRSASEMEVQGGRGKLGADSKTLIRILCRRGDSEASHFLKKHYKIPKSAA